MYSQCFYFVVLLLMGFYTNTSHATQCTEAGRFPNDENNDCRGYIMCLIGGITNFTEYKLTCPQGSIYSHIEKQCTNATNYKCYPNFNCTTNGNFINTESEDCSSFITCVQGISELGTARLVQCPNNTIFNSVLQDCVIREQFVCNTSIVKPDITPTILTVNKGLGVNYGVSNELSCVTTIVFVSFIALAL